MKTRIFLLTEDGCMFATVASVVGALGCEAFGTGSIQGAIRFFRDNLKPGDITIIDLGAGGNGLAILDAIREFHYQPPCIAVTESGADYFQALALVNGAADVLAKPVNAGELIRVVTQVCEHGFRI